MSQIPDTSAPPRRVPAGRRRHDLVCALIVTALLAAPYVCLRAGTGPKVLSLVLVGLLIALAAAGYVATRAGRAAPYVATALLLPYALAAAVVVGGGLALKGALEDAFDDGSTSTSEPDSEEPSSTWTPTTPAPISTTSWSDPRLTQTGDGPDSNGDGVADDAYEGTLCNGLPMDMLDRCVDNGGFTGE